LEATDDRAEVVAEAPKLELDELSGYVGGDDQVVLLREEGQDILGSGIELAIIFVYFQNFHQWSRRPGAGDRHPSARITGYPPARSERPPVQDLSHASRSRRGCRGGCWGTLSPPWFRHIKMIFAIIYPNL